VWGGHVVDTAVDAASLEQPRRARVRRGSHDEASIDARARREHSEAGSPSSQLRMTLSPSPTPERAHQPRALEHQPHASADRTHQPRVKELRQQKYLRELAAAANAGYDMDLGSVQEHAAAVKVQSIVRVWKAKTRVSQVRMSVAAAREDEVAAAEEEEVAAREEEHSAAAAEVFRRYFAARADGSSLTDPRFLADAVGPGRKCLPRHRPLFGYRSEGFKCVAGNVCLLSLGRGRSRAGHARVPRLTPPPLLAHFLDSLPRGSPCGHGHRDRGGTGRIHAHRSGRRGWLISEGHQP